MGKTPTKNSFSTSPFDDSEDDFPEELKRIFSKSKVPLNVQTYLYPIDESEEFHDPFSDLSLFLAKKIKKELLKENGAKGWSQAIEKTIFQAILPEFKRKFPKYRLGSNALKTTFEKVSHYMQFAKCQKGAFQSDGKLNTRLMIRENLKDLFGQKHKLQEHPYTLAHNLAIKISECIATLDAERPNIEELTQTIWAVEKHLLPKLPEEKCPFEKYDTLDKLIVRKQLEILASEPSISQKDLEEQIKRSVLEIKQLSRIRNIHELNPIISSILAERLYPFSKVHRVLCQDEIETILQFIRKEVKKSFQSKVHLETADYLTVVRRILFVCRIAAKLDKDRAERGLKAAIEYVYSLSSGAFTPTGPALKQEMYYFIRSEIIRAKKEKFENPLEEILETLMGTFHEAKKLPKFDEALFDSLEIMTWKVLFEELHLLKKLPHYLKQIAFDELANVHIDHMNYRFEEIVDKTIFHLKQMRDIDTKALARKAFDWSIQGDLASSVLQFDEKHEIIDLLRQLMKKNRLPGQMGTHEGIIEQTLRTFIARHPSLTGWESKLRLRVSIFYKYIWFNQMRSEGESTFERFLKWHYTNLLEQKEQVFPEIYITHLEEVSKTSLPLTPFLADKAREVCRTTRQTQAS